MAWIRACGGGSPAVPDGRTVTPINDVTIWQQCAGIANPTYTTLAEILADVGVLSALMASNNAVDYLVRCKGFSGNASVKVPTMTSNTAPSGQCFGSSISSGSNYFNAFDGVKVDANANKWISNNEKPASLGYKFTSACIVNKFELTPCSEDAPTEFILQGSNDSATWVDIQSYVDNDQVALVTKTYTADNNNSYLYYRLYVTATSKPLRNPVQIVELQFYFDGVTTNSNAMTYIGQNNYASNTLLADSDWQDAIINSAYFESVLNAKVPVMTGNDTPSGHCFEQSNWPSGNAWYAFDGNSTSGNGYIVSTSGTRPTNVRVGYQFTSAPTIYKCIMYPDTNQTIMKPKNAKFQYSTDGITFTDATSYTDVTSLSILTKRLSGITAQYWAVFIDTNQSSNYGLAFRELQFYGRVDV